jgi:hypothetical protein
MQDERRSFDMKAIKTLLVVALAAAGVAVAADSQAASGGGHGSFGGRSVAAGGNWHGGGGNWHGGGGHWNGGHWGGRGYYYGPRFGFYLGAPLFWPSYYWGYGYGYPYDYYPRTVVYGQPVGYPASYPDGGYPDGAMGPAETTQVAPDAQGAPSQGPTYMNYCESSRAYYPKVTSCPEGWKFLPSQR